MPGVKVNEYYTVQCETRTIADRVRKGIRLFTSTRRHDNLTLVRLSEALIEWKHLPVLQAVDRFAFSVNARAGYVPERSPTGVAIALYVSREEWPHAPWKLLPENGAPMRELKEPVELYQTEEMAILAARRKWVCNR
jgi:hypothetical protein